MTKTQSKLPAIKLTIQSINDIITNSSSEVIIIYDKGGVTKLKKLVNSIIQPFTSLRFDDLFTVTFCREWYDNGNDEYMDKEYAEDDPEVEEIWNNRSFEDYPEIRSIMIRPKEGKDCMEEAAKLLKNIAYVFDSEICYG